jgi:hypothetical protein
MNNVQTTQIHHSLAVVLPLAITATNRLPNPPSTLNSSLHRKFGGKIKHQKDNTRAMNLVWMPIQFEEIWSAIYTLRADNIKGAN